MPYLQRSIIYCLLYTIIATSVVLFTLLALHPLILQHLSTHYIGGAAGDGGLYVWLAQSFHIDPYKALALETDTLYPYPLTRAWSDSFLLPSAIIHLLTLSGFHFTTSYNLVILGSLVLNGASSVALARALGVSRPFALLSGILFANSSYIFGNLGHPQLLFFFWVPFSWALVLRSTPQLWRWFLAGLITSAAFYCAVYYAIFAAIGLGLILALRFLTRAFSLDTTIMSALFMLAGLLPIALTLPAYLAIKEIFGSRHLYEAAAFSANGASYLSLSSFNLLFGQTSAWTHAEATLCAGYLVSLVALVFLLKAGLRRAPLLAYTNALLIITVLSASSLYEYGALANLCAGICAWLVLIAALLLVWRLKEQAAILYFIVVTFFILSIGPGGQVAHGEPAVAPLAFLYNTLPGLDSMRAVGRYGIVVVMGLYIAACWGISLIALKRSGAATVIALSLTIITLLENFVARYPLDAPPPAPLAFESLAKLATAHEATIVLPFTERNDKGEPSWSQMALLSSYYSIWSAALKLPLVNGYSGQRSRLQYGLSEKLQDFPSEAAISYLSRICGLRWIVIAPSLFKNWNEQVFNTRLARFSERLRVVNTHSDGSLLLEILPQLVATAGHPAIIIAPKSADLLLTTKQLSAETAGGSQVGSEKPCNIKLSRIRHKQGPSEEISRYVQLKQETRLPLLANPMLDPGAPASFQIESGPSCQVLVSCSISYSEH